MKKTAVLVLAFTFLLANTIITATASGASRAGTKTVQAADSLLSMMPDADGVIAINVAQLNRQIQSILVQKPETAAELQKQFDKMVAETGVDIRSIDSLVAGISLASGRQSPDPLVIISGSFNQEQVLASLARKSGKKWKGKNYNGQKVYTEAVKKKSKKPANPAALTFFDSQTIAFGTAESVRKSIDTRAGIQSSVLQNSVLMGAYNQANLAGSVRFAFNLPEQLRQRIRESNLGGSILRPLSAITQIVGTADLNDTGLLANISLITGSDQEAAEVVALINNGLILLRYALGGNPQAAPILAILSGITNTQAGNAANLTVNVPADLIRTLLDQIKSRAPKA